MPIPDRCAVAPSTAHPTETEVVAVVHVSYSETSELLEIKISPGPGTLYEIWFVIGYPSLFLVASFVLTDRMLRVTSVSQRIHAPSQRPDLLVAKQVQLWQ